MSASTWTMLNRRHSTSVAVPGNQPAEVVDDDGAMVKVKRKNYLLAAAELAAIGITDEPARGDTITETLDGGTVETWEVIGPGGQPPWNWHDDAHTQYRINVQLIGEA